MPDLAADPGGALRRPAAERAAMIYLHATQGADRRAWALLGAVTDAPTQARAYGELLGSSGGR
jgi:hypothetical protein